MAKKVQCRAARRKARAVERAQQREQQQAVRQHLLARIAAVVTEVLEAALEAEVTARLGRPRYARRLTAPPQRTGLVCSRCQQDWASRLWRAGHYPRTLLLLFALVPLRVP